MSKVGCLIIVENVQGICAYPHKFQSKSGVHSQPKLKQISVYCYSIPVRFLYIYFPQVKLIHKMF